MKLIAIAFCAFLMACEGPVGPAGPQGPEGQQGPTGPQGAAWTVEEVTGTVLNRNYTEGNPEFASIHVTSSRAEPTVLYFAWENDNGVYINLFVNVVVWRDGDNEDHSVSGMDGWYLVVYDSEKSLVGKNYKLRYVQ